ncbi:FcoT family thioesterase [Haliangium ochraceum]|uniref:(2E)-enoyl-[ACP] glycyltransferase n=1 Tax=Haliangium ochraceum (strain DSM 14365 / JCM 11303 / SMP-2) TaxID=502025 RepID=D0LJY4_HALO1|nr:FcoT family thioesterase [Haliangium ochraceum]ACY18491.1 hypothetical protein Hoch_6016 [Haliangium ochraceum DSM 14365]
MNTATSALCQEADARRETVVTVDERFLEHILTPYMTPCKYLKSVDISYDPSASNGVLPAKLRARGRFSIGESCYIEDTGHFNAVEFIMCFNQIGYVLLAHALQAGLVRGVPAWGREDFAERQLPDVLIVNAKSTFRRMIDARDFVGEAVWTRASARGDHLFGSFDVSFYDAAGGRSTGETFCCVRNMFAERSPAPSPVLGQVAHA